jgi:hypothetical protein
LWACVEGGDEKWFVGEHKVPTSSSRARKAEELIQWSEETGIARLRDTVRSRI